MPIIQKNHQNPKFDVFWDFWVLKGSFLEFWIFQNPKTVLESEQAHLGGSKKRKKNLFDHSSAFKKNNFGF